MIRNARSNILPLAIFLSMTCHLLTVFATPHWSQEQVQEEFTRSQAAWQLRFDFPTRLPSTSLDEIAYFLHYRMLCDFLVTMQYTDAGPNHGGMIKGESEPDHSIIETDNTQEAIRVWSQYAVWTGDTARYAPSIRLAQGYCQRFPAWREGNDYYGLHNCGWGFEAERIYRTAYGDTSWTWYADSCARHVVTYPLPFDPHSTDLGQLNPLAEGLGIGGMYTHTLYRGRTDWQDFVLNQARRLRTWFESNPARLNANEVWALCGGTALWGVCASLFTQYPDSGSAWLDQYGSQLDIWQSSGTWNHSATAWYCNAQHTSFEITQDSTYWNNAVFITDSLIGLDTDEDGGIPPGISFPPTNDHSWVSAYMGWMGMERIINSSPASDLAAASFVSPAPTLPHLAGDSLIVAIQVMNAGRTTLSGRARVSGSFMDSADVSLSSGRDTVIIFSQRWILPDDESLPPSSPLHFFISSPGDQNPQNDTLSVAFDIRRGVNISGMIWGNNPPNTVGAHVEFFHEAYPDSAWVAVESLPGQPYSNGSRRLLAGLNRIVVTPAIEYLPAEATLNLTPAPNQYNFALSSTDLVLVDDDVNRTYEQYFLSSLDSFDMNVRLWNRNSSALPDLAAINTVIWFTGNDDSTTLFTADQITLASYLSGGGHFLLTGQNIVDDWEHTSEFLDTVLHCTSRSQNANSRRVDGMTGNMISDSLELTLIGTQGANNQTSPASVFVEPGSETIFRYMNADSHTCGVSGTYGNGRFVFLSFGLEAATGINNTSTRDDVMARCFSWFGDSSTSAFERPAFVPMEISLAQNYPNPFNPTTTIRFSAPTSSGNVKLVIYNLLGQEVCRLYEGAGQNHELSVVWNGQTAMGHQAASGFYVYSLEAGATELSRTLHLLR